MKGLANGKVEVSAKGYLIVQPDALELPVGSDLKDLQVLVTEAGHLSGHVTSAVSGQPIMTAEVTVWDSAGNFVGRALTYQSGTFGFDTLRAGSYTITCSAPGHAPATKERGDVSPKRTTRSAFTLGPEALISGRVILAVDGLAVEGAVVEVRGASTGTCWRPVHGCRGRYGPTRCFRHDRPGPARRHSQNVLERLSDLFVCRGVPDYIRSDNGPESAAEAVRSRLGRVGVKTLFIEPGRPWENGYIESFNGKLRDELLNGEIFDTLWDAKVLIERWRCEYNTIRPRSAGEFRQSVLFAGICPHASN